MNRKGLNSLLLTLRAIFAWGTCRSRVRFAFHFRLSQGTLGKWVARMRALYKKGELPEDRIQLLRDVNFTFVLKMDEWMKNYDEVRAVGLKKLGARLQYWVNDQRSKRRRNLLAMVRFLPIFSPMGI